MAYTHTWDENAPAGSAQASTLDDVIRALKQDIRERMNTILATDGKWDDAEGDDIVVDTSGVGVRTGVAVYYTAHQFASRYDEDDVTLTDTYIQGDSQDGRYLWIDLRLPIGAHIKTCNVIIDKYNATSASLILQYNDWGTSMTSTLVTTATSHTGSGITDVEVYNGDFTIADGYMVHLRVGNTGGSVRVYGVKVVLDLPSLSAYV